jgi:hypothetical protein
MTTKTIIAGALVVFAALALISPLGTSEARAQAQTCSSRGGHCTQTRNPPRVTPKYCHWAAIGTNGRMPILQRVCVY